MCISSFDVLASANREGTTCSFADPAFVVYSSVASFYVPFIVTLLVYAQICVVLRKRGRRTAPPRKHGLLAQSRAGAGEGRHRKVEFPVMFIFFYHSFQASAVCDLYCEEVYVFPEMGHFLIQFKLVYLYSLPS